MKIRNLLKFVLLSAVLLGVCIPHGMIICKDRAHQKVCHSKQSVLVASHQVLSEADSCMTAVEKLTVNVTLKNGHLSYQKDFTLFKNVHFPDLSDNDVETVFLVSANDYLDKSHLYLLKRQLIL